MRKGLWFGVSVAAVTLATIWHAAPAAADSAGDAALAAADAADNRAQTNIFDYEVTNHPSGAAEETLAFTIRTKGAKHLIEVTAPASARGTKVLSTSSTQVYLYTPSSGHVRRIGADAVDQAFLGTTFSVNDLVRTVFGEDYTATISAQSPIVLSATPKPGRQPFYKEIDITLDATHNTPTELKYFDSRGAHIKSETRTGYSCDAGVCTPGEDKMTDSVTGSWTKLVRKTWRVNAAISDDIFTMRALAN